ncbi:MAG: alpha-ketoglutarate-dependent dioxygenase AlkB [Flavobacteriaceae bacterium]|nr:alpha-ketoglutarate-dependent dioxygenase AlkB [Flavobacteriaceae bacterium]
MTKGFDLKLRDADIWYYPNFFSAEESSQYFKKLFSETNWQQDDITVFGKTYKQPRLTALYANNEKSYSYSNIIMYPHLFTNELLDIKHKIETVIDKNFTTCLLNLYRDGQDSNGWHADNEKELGKNPVIASVSFGANRMFHFKHRYEKELKHKLVLESGSLLVMKGETQHFWLHQIPKTKKKVGTRINLTFRVIK